MIDEATLGALLKSGVGEVQARSYTIVEARKRLLEDACNSLWNGKKLFFRTFIVAEDGLVDIIEDDSSDTYWNQSQVRPGLWRSYQKYTDNLDPLGLWAVWVADGDSLTLLKQMAGLEEVTDYIKESIEARTPAAYVETLDWQLQEGGAPSGEFGTALRSRFVLSADFRNFMHGNPPSEKGEGEDADTMRRWNETIDEWYHIMSAFAEVADYIDLNEIGGAVIGMKAGMDRFSLVKDDQGQTVGILIGRMEEEEYEEDSIQMDYEEVEHSEALDDISGLHPVKLTCIHGGDPGLQTATPNYLPTFEVTLQVSDLLANTKAIAARLVIEYLIDHQREFINPYVDFPRQGLDQVVTLDKVTFDKDSSFWAQLRRQDSSSKTHCVTFHLPDMAYVIHENSASWKQRFLLRDAGVIEWTAPEDWHRPSLPTLCPPDQYRLEPVFRYVGCGYALTPSSAYPPLKASHIWRWVPPEIDTHISEKEGLYDPYGVHYEMPFQEENLELLLGHTVMALSLPSRGASSTTASRRFLDIFGVDPRRRLLFGWVRLGGNDDSRNLDECLALSLPGGHDDSEILTDDSPSLAPIKRVEIQAIGLPRLTSILLPAEQLDLVPLIFRQAPSESSPTLIDDIVIHVPRQPMDSFSIRRYPLETLLREQLISKGLLHPLFANIFIEIIAKRGSSGTIMLGVHVEENESLWLALSTCIARGLEPTKYGLIVHWNLGGELAHVHCEAYQRLPMPINRQMPVIDGAEPWVAPQDWFEPAKPTIDPSGHYHRLDVMSYVGWGHVLPPWATYPPHKTRFIWSRLNHENMEKNSYKNNMAGAEMIVQTRLLDILGQTALIKGWEYKCYTVDVIAVDEARGLIFGMSRMVDHDEFLCLQLEDFKTAATAQMSTLPNPGLKPYYVNVFGLPCLTENT